MSLQNSERRGYPHPLVGMLWKCSSVMVLEENADAVLREVIWLRIKVKQR